ncbi:MAG: alpha-L-fucosidase [Clostridia bacterium]|nr:alpha-L-fucosidase [Clostridia bacterium]
MSNKSNLTSFGSTPSDRQIHHLRDVSKKAFFHFGVNTFTDMEWGEGVEKESVFNPSACDVRQWIKGIKAAGFNFAILTAKHHDGFCLWPSKYTEHSIKNSPYKNGKGDIVREFTDACREFDIECGLYLSPWDRHSPYWGSVEYSKHYNDQLVELLTNYGKIDEVWWDGAGSQDTPYDWDMWANTVRTLQPTAVMFGSLGATPHVECRWVGNEGGFAHDTHYPTIDAVALETEHTPTLGKGTFGGNRFIPAEVDVSIRPGWFYHDTQDDSVKSVPQLVDLWFNSIGRSAMMLLNFPPNRCGLVCDTDIKNAVDADRIISKTFAANLAADGCATSNSVLEQAYEPDFMLDNSYNTFYAAAEDNITPVIEINLPREVEFDTFAIGEKVEYGVRVNDFKVEALVDGEWKLLARKQSMGYLRAERFEPVKTDKIRITVLSAAAAPVIRTFGLYKLPDEYYEAIKAEKEILKDAVDLAHLPTSKIIEEERGVKVEFGGIYPFNTVCFNGTNIWSYEIHAFDGSDYFCVYEGSKPAEYQTVHLPETVKYSYQMKLITNKGDNKNIDIKIFEL